MSGDSIINQETNNVLCIHGNHFISVSWCISSNSKNKLQNFPPTLFPNLPLIGHLYLLRKKNVPFHMTWSQVSRKYGPVLYLWFGSRPVLLVSSPSAAEECFTKNDIIFANRPTMLVGELLNYNSSTLAWLPYGYHWRNLRRIATIELLSSKTVRMLSPIRVDEVRSLIQRLFFQVSDENNLERIVDIKSALVELAFNVMTRMICAKTYYGESMENAVDLKIFGGVVAEISNEARKSTILDFMPFLRFFGYRKVVKKLVELNEKRDKLLQKLVEDNRRIRSDDDPALTDRVQGRNRSMIQVLMQLQASEPENYPDEIIKGLIMILYQASSQTTSSTMEWAFSLLLNHPEVMKKAKVEIGTVIGNSRLMDDPDVAQLPYLQCIIKETLRLHPPTPLLLPHFSSEDCTVGGFHVPRGTMLLVNVWAIHHDPNVWMEPEKFIPERFKGIEGTNDGFKLMPFGSGRRRCPGENLAIGSIGLALGTLLQCFDWERISSQDIDMSEVSGLVAPKIQPLRVKCYPRPNMVDLLSQQLTKPI